MKKQKVKNKNSRVIIVLGAPGSGKGTQAELLSEKLNYYYFETSKILEDKFENAKRGEFIKVEGKVYKIDKEKKFWKTGILCSPPFVSYLVKQKIKELNKDGKSLILSGSPRTIYEGKQIIPLLKKLYGKKNIKVVLLEINAKETLFRNSHRRICKLMRHPIMYSKETKDLTKCPLDGSKLIKRKGLDDPESIKVRLKEYRKRTLPLIDYLREKGLAVKKVNGSPPPGPVFKNVLKAIK